MVQEGYEKVREYIAPTRRLSSKRRRSTKVEYLEYR